MADSPDLSLLLHHSIESVRKRERDSRIWSEEELRLVHEQIDEELWRVRSKGLACSR